MVSCAAIAVLVGSAIIARPVLASAYEWISSLTIPSTVYAGATTTMRWTVSTNGTYKEFRSLYYSTTTSPYNWNEWTDCRKVDMVSTTTNDGCDVVIPHSSVSTTELWVRASTHYGNCGDGIYWTPTPDEINCGGTMTSSTSWFN